MGRHAGTLHLSLSPCLAECQRLHDSMALPTFSESLTLCLSPVGPIIHPRTREAIGSRGLGSQEYPSPAVSDRQ